MILKDEDVEKRLTSPLNLVNKIKNPNVDVLPCPKGGKTTGAKNIPPLVRELLGSFAGQEKDSDIADAFDVSTNLIQKSEKGLIGNRYEPSLKQEDDRTDNAHEMALDLLMKSMGALGPKLLDSDLKAKDLSRIASDMSKIVSSVRGNDDGKKNHLRVIILAPEQKSLTDFEFIEA